MNRTISFALSFLFSVSASAADAQSIRCVRSPDAIGTEAACRITADAGEREILLVLQLLSAERKPIEDGWIRLQASNGAMRDSVVTGEKGLAHVIWTGPVRDQPAVITASADVSGRVTRQEIRIAKKEAKASPPYVTRLAPLGGHSAFAGKYLDDDVEVQIEADPTTCIRTTVIFEYLSVGTAATPEPKRIEQPALWSELDPGRFGCTAQLRWVLSPAVGDQELRTWIKRDSTFVLPADPAGAQRYLEPRVVHAVAHAQPAFLVGAAVIDSSEDDVAVPKVVGLDMSFPSFAEFLKHQGLDEAGRLVDRFRLFAGTDFGEDLGDTVYIGFEPVVLLVGPRAADLPIALAVGSRFGKGDDGWFGAGLVNAAQLAQLVAQGLGFGGTN